MGRTIDWIWNEIEKLNWECDVETKFKDNKRYYKCTIKKYEDGNVKWYREFTAGNKIEATYKALVWLIVNKGKENKID